MHKLMNLKVGLGQMISAGLVLILKIVMLTAMGYMKVEMKEIRQLVIQLQLIVRTLDQLPLMVHLVVLMFLLRLILTVTQVAAVIAAVVGVAFLLVYVPVIQSVTLL